MSQSLIEHGIESTHFFDFRATAKPQVIDTFVGCRQSPSLGNNPNFCSIHKEPGLLVATDSVLRHKNEVASSLELSASTLSNSALLALSYKKWGDDCVKHIQGDFSFVVVDQVQQRVMFARDPLGKHPLYYHQSNNSLLFSTEIKTLFRGLNIEPKINRERIADVAFGLFGSKKAPTFYDGILSFLPGYVAIYENGILRQREYWQPDVERRINNTDEDTLAEFRYLFGQTVESFFNIGLNPGALLSGGLDSSSLVSVAAHNNKDRCIKAYSSVPLDPYSKRASGDSEYLNCFKDYPNIEINEVRCTESGPLSGIQSALKNREMPLIASAHYRYKKFGDFASKNHHNILLTVFTVSMVQAIPQAPFTGNCCCLETGVRFIENLKRSSY